jgi:hypothetical protein
VYERELVHIYNRHKKELSTIGMTAFDFVKFIVDNYNEIYKGTDNTVWLVVKRVTTSNMAAIEMNLSNEKKDVYKIKTAAPVNTVSLSRKQLLCANDR